MKKTKIAVFFGGKITGHLVLVRRAARRLGVELDLISYNRVVFGTESGKVKIRTNEERETKKLEDYNVLFFRTTGKHGEEVDLILDQISKIKNQKLRPVIVDPMVRWGKSSYACKAWQMLKLKEAGIPVPRTVYGSLWYLYQNQKSNIKYQKFDWPVIVKGSGGDRGTRVFKANNLGELERLVRDLRRSETDEGRRYMLQEYIENKGDYRVLILGKKVLGVMKRTAGEGDFRNNYSMGGKVEVSDLPETVKQMAVRAAEVCGLWVAGVDLMPNPSKSPLDDRGDLNNYVVLEVNKGPQFKGFMKATGIDVPAEIVKFLVSLRN